MNTKKLTIAILTGGGDVPGLNPAIRAVTFRALHEGHRVIGVRRGWGGLVDLVRDAQADNSQNYQVLTEEIVDRAGRTGGTFLHTSRTNPSRVKQVDVPPHLKTQYSAPSNDLTEEVLKNMEFLGIDYLIPIGGDDTLSYGVRLHREGVRVIAIPKTMDNDVPGTDYCIGFSTCVTRTIAAANNLRTVAGSHERFVVLEVLGRYAGFTALLPTMAGAAHRCLIPECKFNIDRLTELLSLDRRRNPSGYAIVIVSEGASYEEGGMVFADTKTDAFGHAKLGGIGSKVASAVQDASPRFNSGKLVHVLDQQLGYIVRGGDPDAMDSIVPMVYGNLALDLILKGQHGRLVALRDGRYTDVPMEVVTASKKVVDVEEFYDVDRYRPKYENFQNKPQFVVTSEG